MLRPMRVRVGTSGFSYKEWKGSFYPEDLPESKMLRFYGEHFDTVEINNTFYRMPKPGVLEAWTKEVPASFAFVLKGPQWLSHWGKLAGREAWAESFFTTAAALGKKRGPLLVAIPPYLKKDLGLLDAFFALVPKAVRVALEVGNDTWLDDDTYAALRQRNASLCIVDDPKKRIPVVPTADWGYLRLRETTYGPRAIAKWAQTILAQPWKEAFVFFKHEDEGTGPRLAAALKGALARHEGAVLGGRR
jgi:uncharacterized protein YecE (DUF72 family)